MLKFVMGMICGALLASACSASRAQEPVPAAPHPLPMIQPIIIEDSPGGVVDTFAYFYGAIRASHVPVILRGVCISACTLVLSLPKDQVCVEPTAILGFHEASISGVPNMIITKSFVRRFYPPIVQKWLATQTITPEPILVGADDIVKFGWLNPC